MLVLPYPVPAGNGARDEEAVCECLLEAAAEELAPAREEGVFVVGPQWDTEQLRAVRQWALSVPEIVHLSVMTPYPGKQLCIHGRRSSQGTGS